jgi:hypothetical protein
MDTVIRPAAAQDALAWVDLLKASLGQEYPDRQVYEPAWVEQQLAVPGGVETWVAEAGGRLQAAISFLPPFLSNVNPIANLGRDLFRPDSYSDGSARALVTKITQLGQERRLLMVARVLASDNLRQALFEQLDFVCVGFQPFKHMLRSREGALFYVRMGGADMVTRCPLSESLPQVSELVAHVLSNLKLPQPISVRDGATGYPLQTEAQFQDVPYEEYLVARLAAQPMNPPAEISGGYNLGWGLLRCGPPAPPRALMARRGATVVGGLAYAVDEHDRCVRLCEGYATDDLSTGALVQRVTKLAQERFNAIYVEADVLVTAPRLLKSAEQLGFVPVAYLPGFFYKQPKYVDVVKLVKLNLAYGLENARLTTHAKSTADIVDRNFQDQKVGVAIVNLLHNLAIFDGLGDGELRKVARLFTQKLYRANERIFSRGDSGSEAYIVMRGQIEIRREDQPKPIATFGHGQIFGEIAFLDGAPRTALAVPTQPSILLVVQRDAFNELVQREPHLGMVVMRNIALELSRRLRTTTGPAAEPKK